MLVSTAIAPLTPAVSEDRNGLLAAADAELSTTSSRSSARSSLLGVADAVDDSSRSANGFVGGNAADYNVHTHNVSK